MNKYMLENNLSKINSFSISILLSANFIATIVSSIGVMETGLLPLLFLLAVSLSIIASLYYKNHYRINKYSLALIAFIIIAFLLSYYKFDTYYTNKYFIEFLAFGVLVFIITMIPYSSKYILLYTMYTGIFILLNPIEFIDFVNLNTSIDRVDMGASYAILPPILATIIYVILGEGIRSGNKFLTFFSIFCNSYLLYILISQGTRGAVLSLLILFVIIFYYSMVKKFKNKDTLLFPTIYTIAGIIFVFLIFNIERVLNSLNQLLLNLGWESATFLKTVELLNNEGLVGILNNRDAVYEKAFTLFKNSPIFGNGIGSFASIYNGTYPHNFVLQLLVEGGLLLTIPFLIIISSITIFILKPKLIMVSKEDVILVLFLFLISIPRLMLSSYLWKNQAFWLLIFISISLLIKKNRSQEFYKIENKNISYNSMAMENKSINWRTME